CPEALAGLSLARPRLPGRPKGQRGAWIRPSGRQPKSPPGEKQMSDWVLSEQLAMYRTMDALDRARYNNELEMNHTLLRRNAEQIDARYNQLVAEFNGLLQRATEVAQEADRKDAVIAELRHTNAALEAERDRLRQENKTKASEIELLYNIVRQDHPDFYLP